MVNHLCWSKGKDGPPPVGNQFCNLPGFPDICPWELLKNYVAMTSTHITVGSTVFRGLHHPFSPLTSNSIGRITKQALSSLGIPMQIWKAHSTRGAGVAMYKNLGLTSEQVCELGKWKNVQAFSQHYLRIGAHKVASQKILPFLVHKVSPLRSAKPDYDDDAQPLPPNTTIWFTITCHLI